MKRKQLKKLFSVKTQSRIEWLLNCDEKDLTALKHSPKFRKDLAKISTILAGIHESLEEKLEVSA